MSQQLLNEITRMSKAIVALAERVTALEQRPEPVIGIVDNREVFVPGSLKRGPDEITRMSKAIELITKAVEALAERVNDLEGLRGTVPTQAYSEIQYQLTKLAESPVFIQAVREKLKRPAGRPRVRPADGPD